MPSLTSSPPLLTLPVDKSSLFNHLFGLGSERHEVLASKFIGVPRLSLPTGISHGRCIVHVCDGPIYSE